MGSTGPKGEDLVKARLVSQTIVDTLPNHRFFIYYFTNFYVILSDELNIGVREEAAVVGVGAEVLRDEHVLLVDHPLHDRFHLFVLCDELRVTRGVHVMRNEPGN